MKSHQRRLFTRQRLAQAFALVMLVTQLGQMGFAAEPAGAEPPSAAPPAIQTAKPTIDAKKLALAKELTTWMQATLQEKKALVAVVARKGGEDVKKHDKTGMAHTGLAVYDPRAQTWLIYNLVQETKKPDSSPGPATESIWRTAPLDFYYGQTGYDKEALLLIPDVETQQRVYEAILNGNYKKLNAVKTYNLLSPYDSVTSLNCNKWLLFNLAAAHLDNYDPAAVAAAIHTGFQPGELRLSPLEEIFVRRKSNVILSELPKHPPIQTVTVESLYRSNLFQEKLFYSGKTAL